MRFSMSSASLVELGDQCLFLCSQAGGKAGVQFRFGGVRFELELIGEPRQYHLFGD